MSRLQRGKDAFDSIYGEGNADSLIGKSPGAAQDLVRYAISYEFADVYSRPALNLGEREMIALACLTTLGGFDAELEGHTKGALNVGVSPDAIIETVINATQFAGFTRGLHAVRVVAESLIRLGADLPEAMPEAAMAEPDLTP